jgi:hydrogenase maturation protein HypF
MSRAIGDPDSANREVRVPGSIEAFSRVAHLRTFVLPGGDAAARQPRRSALGLLYEIFGEAAANYAKDWFPPGELKTLLQMLHRGANCPRTSSMGRLFDAIAALVGLAPPSGKITFEGQAAMALEFAAETTSSLPLGEETESTDSPLPLAGTTEWSGPGVRAYRIPLQPAKNGPLIADWEPMIREILAEHAAGVPTTRISLKFHRALAEMAVEVAKSVNLPQIVLSGGCFQNALLLRQTYSRLIEAGFQVFLPQQFPPGDGGIALGQVFIAGLTPSIE